MTSLDQLLQILAQINIKLNAEDGKLNVNAEKGALTPDLVAALKHHKAALIALLQRSASEQVEPVIPSIEIDPEHRYEPFAFSDLQLGFYMANDPYMEYQVRPHYYVENDHQSFDVKRYEHAWNKALKRHKGEIFLVTAEAQLQHMQALPVIKIPVEDFRHLTAEQTADALESKRKRLMRQELPLDRWPWFDLQVSLWRKNDLDIARVHYNHNNFFFDGFGTGQLLLEIKRYYENPQLSLPPIELSFRDAALGLAKLAESELGQRAKDYWLKRLPDLPPPPALPQKPQMNRRCRSRLQRREKILSADIWRSFKTHAATYGVTASSAINAAYAEVISAWSNSQHFIFSHMVTRRFAEMHPDIKHILGNFASLYPLEVDLRGNDSFKERARRLQAQILMDAKHFHFGGMQVMQALNRLKGELGSSPSPFVVGSALFMEGFQKSDFSCLETSQTIMDHQFWELADGQYYYVWDLLEEFFPEGMIDSMWQAFAGLIQKLAENANSWEETAFMLVPKPEREKIALINSTSVPVPSELLHDALDTAVKADPSKLMLSMSQVSLSYQALDQWSRGVASHLRTLKIGTKDRVAIVADRGPQLLAAVMGCLRSGAAYVPVDPGLPQERRRYLINHSQCRVALTQTGYAERLEWPDEIDLVRVDECDRPDSSAINLPKVMPSELAYIIYTSGSTGTPKGVMIDHRGALNTILDINRRFEVGPKDKIFGVSSFSFDLSVYDIFGTLSAGATLVYPEPETALNPAHWLDLLTTKEVTVWNSVPALMSLLVDTAQRQKVILPELRLVLLSGDWIPMDLPAAIWSVAPNAKVISLGGATEASIWSIYYPIEAIDPAWSSIPYGFPLANQGWHIRDQRGRPTPIWTEGELYISGVGLAHGYWDDAKKTDKSFIRDADSGELLYRTGDRGRYLKEGAIEFLGRVDFQVKIQGHRIELGEIETTLISHPAVKETVVMAQISGEKKTRQLVAYVVFTATNTECTTDKLQAFLQQKLPAYMVPVGWVVLEKLPITSNGKIDRKALSVIGATIESQQTRSRRNIAPRNPTEVQLAAIWSQILKCKEIGVEDDFFELGGQSFDAIRISAIVKEQMGQTITLGDIWQKRTIEQLAKQLNENKPEQQQQNLLTIKAQGSGTPCFFVHPAGGHTLCYRALADKLNHPVYGFQAPGLDGVTKPLTNIGTMARLYVTEMRQKQAQGSYILGGWSSGAMIAFEMAAQLEQMGESVDQVVMLDGPTPFQAQEVDDETFLHWFLEDLALDLPLSLLKGVVWTGLTEAEQLSKALDLLATTELSLDASQLLPIFRVFKAVVLAGGHYQPPTITADILVLRAAEGLVSEFAKHPYRNREDWGWGLFSTGSVRSQLVAGSHHTLLIDPWVNRVADEINASMPLS